MGGAAGTAAWAQGPAPAPHPRTLSSARSFSRWGAGLYLGCRTTVSARKLRPGSLRSWSPSTSLSSWRLRVTGSGCELRSPWLGPAPAPSHPHPVPVPAPAPAPPPGNCACSQACPRLQFGPGQGQGCVSEMQTPGLGLILAGSSLSQCLHDAAVVRSVAGTWARLGPSRPSLRTLPKLQRNKLFPQELRRLVLATM